MITRNKGQPKTSSEETAVSNNKSTRSLRVRTNATNYFPTDEDAEEDEVDLKRKRNDKENTEDEPEEKKTTLKGSNPFERFEALLDRTNNLSTPVTMEDLMALHENNLTKQNKKSIEQYKMLSSGYDKSATFYDETPEFMNAVMRDYQVAGLNWMLALQKAGLNGILADEMGLGKTIQTISLLAHNKIVEKSASPNLVIVPLTTLLNWRDEIERFCPKLRVFVLHGTMDEREQLMKTRMRKQDFDVCIISYETALRLTTKAFRVHFNYVVIDEGQRIKNENVRLAKGVRTFKSNRRLLLTGTPFNNNVHEVWALLNYLAPAIFTDALQFEEYFSSYNLSVDVDIVNRLHRILNPFILRRVKADVEKSLLPKKEYKIYVGFTELQKIWYQKVLSKEGIAIMKKDGSTKMKKVEHVMMALREVANHPYMFPAAEPSGPPFITDETIVTASGKMMVLDKMLEKFKSEGSRVLIFSQFTMMLDILEDYAIYREYDYCRFDGQTNHDERHEMVSEFNQVGSEKFVFLMSTRSGGLGINLASADIVIIYDSDWNPQMDFQACDRAHRIGQKKQVRVFRLISEKTVDDYIMETNEHKVRLGNVVIQDRDEQMRVKKSKKDMVKMIMDGSHKVLAGSIETIGDIDIEKMLKEAEERSEKENPERMKLFQSNEQYLVHNKSEHPLYEYSGKNHWGLWPKKPDVEIFEDKLRMNRKFQPIGERALTLLEFWKNFGLEFHGGQVYNYKFYPKRYIELCEKKLAFLRSNNQILLLKTTDKLNLTVKSKVDLTVEEIQEMEKLKEEAACRWSWFKFLAFVGNLRGIDKNDYASLATKSNSNEAEIKRYMEIMWERLDELPNSDQIKENVEAYERTSGTNKDIDQVLANACAICDQPEKQLFFDYSLENWDLDDFGFLPAEDRYLIATLQQKPFHVDNIQGFFLNELGMIRSSWPMRYYPVHVIKKRFDYLIEIIKKGGVRKLVEEPIKQEEVLHDSVNKI
ncbi:unnamed protein product [Caenorhabditis angaria]|uniref:Uncharacterized protein n=1 Tax=Caenorhabditis angaria TaxID=860376 RepID=A0A9P1I5E7_9PELO|nr:unnamed protein product [Caenorhabditis angaria]